MNTDPSCDPEFQLDFQSGAYRQDLLGHGSVRVNLAGARGAEAVSDA